LCAKASKIRIAYRTKIPYNKHMKSLQQRDYIIGAIGFIILATSLWYGVWYSEPINRDDHIVICTQDARQCPDGSYVGRVGPSCEFAACPALQNLQKTTQEKPDPKAVQSTLTALNAQATSTVEIRYTDRGFNPDTITVNKGTTVFFINNSNKAFWPTTPIVNGTFQPANFDAGTAIVTGGKYQYTFTTAGTWTYHDRFATTSKGTVIVN